MQIKSTSQLIIQEIYGLHLLWEIGTFDWSTQGAVSHASPLEFISWTIRKFTYFVSVILLSELKNEKLHFSLLDLSNVPRLPSRHPMRNDCLHSE